ncbi:hypothetical protein ACLB1O_08375 [Escherichia coli]
MLKRVIGLAPERFNHCFNITGEEGAAWPFAGSPSDGLMGRGISLYQQGFHILGAGLWIGCIADAQKSVPQMLEDFDNTSPFAR